MLVLSANYIISHGLDEHIFSVSFTDLFLPDAAAGFYRRCIVKAKFARFKTKAKAWTLEAKVWPYVRRYMLQKVDQKQ